MKLLFWFFCVFWVCLHLEENNGNRWKSCGITKSENANYYRAMLNSAWMRKKYERQARRVSVSSKETTRTCGYGPLFIAVSFYSRHYLSRFLIPQKKLGPYFHSYL